MMAQQCDLQVGDFIWTGGDCHIYLNHRGASGAATGARALSVAEGWRSNASRNRSSIIVSRISSLSISAPSGDKSAYRHMIPMGVAWRIAPRLYDIRIKEYGVWLGRLLLVMKMGAYIIGRSIKCLKFE